MEPGDDATTLSLQEFVTALESPAAVVDRYLDVVAANRLAGAVTASFTVGTNLARFTFLNPFVEDSIGSWDLQAERNVGMLRDSVERFEEDDRFRDLLGELMARSPVFATKWAARSAVPERRGVTEFDNPLVGRLALGFEQLRRHGDDEYVVVLWAPVDDAARAGLRRLRELVADV
ncbi:hypothetical protein [Curtobacterium sp. ISL-83]|uniref:MmyB family transcriptional regulator n=1 Tax=Curtobacterium sp. ISL-83 TaxID=2819145 RepID=UPI001BE4E7AB|nr:hypothetical protein [Curtobacterium sp. ISL-83]MBT2502757.1 hypothetical protein [Curtobacterium sp. ISL-83]